MKKTATEVEQESSRAEYWAIAPSGETYAVEIMDGKVTGVCGALHYTEVTRANLEDGNFEYTDEDVAWIQDQEHHIIDPNIEYPVIQDDGALTQKVVLELSEALDPNHQGECWPDPIAWDGRSLQEQAEALLVLADAELESITLPDSDVQARLRAATEAVRAVLGVRL